MHAATPTVLTGPVGRPGVLPEPDATGPDRFSVDVADELEGAGHSCRCCSDQGKVNTVCDDDACPGAKTDAIGNPATTNSGSEHHLSYLDRTGRRARQVRILSVVRRL